MNLGKIIVFLALAIIFLATAEITLYFLPGNLATAYTLGAVGVLFPIIFSVPYRLENGRWPWPRNWDELKLILLYFYRLG